MNGNSNYRKGGGTKDFKADPIKQFLTCRGTNMSYAKDLCVANLISLSEIRDWTDRFTVLQFGKLKVDPKIDAEVMRIASRLKSNLAAKEAAKSEFDHFTEQNPVENDELDRNASDQEASEFDVEKERELYEQEKAAEEAAQAQTTEPDDTDAAGRGEPGEGDTICKRCGKEYKTLRGLLNHIKNKHSGKAEPQYGDHR